MCSVYAEGTRLSMNSEGRVCADFGDFPAMGVKEGYLHDEDTDLLLRVQYERCTRDHGRREREALEDE